MTAGVAYLPWSPIRAETASLCACRGWLQIGVPERRGMAMFGSRGPKKFEEALSRAEERLRAYRRRPDLTSSDAVLDAYLVAVDAWPAGGPGLDDRFVILTVNLAAALTDAGRGEREPLAAAVSIGQGARDFIPPRHYAREAPHQPGDLPRGPVPAGRGSHDAGRGGRCGARGRARGPGGSP